jgi:hypothetical protein
MQDPLATFYAALASWRLGKRELQRASRELSAIVRAQVLSGEHSWTWDPVGEFGEQNGRLGSTAVALLILTIYYRYCQLEAAQGS